MAAIAALSSKALASSEVAPASPTMPTYLLPESARAQATKPLREIYIGNLPPATTGPHLLAFLNAHIIAAGLVIKGGGPIPVGGQLATSGPIISCRVNSGAQFGFAEFRSIEETIMAIAMGGLALGALQLKFGRPKAFVSLYGDDSVTMPQAAQHIRELMAQGVPDKAGPDWPAGAIFPFTVQRIASARPGVPLHFLPDAPAAPQPAASAPAVVPAAAAVTPAASTPASAAPVPMTAGVPVSQSSGVVTASMGAAALAQTSVSASAAQPSAGPATSAGAPPAPEPDRTSSAVDVTGGVGVFAEDDMREMFGGFGTITRCLMLPAGETPTRVVVEFSSPTEAETAVALDGLVASDEPLHVRVMRVDEPLACAPSPCVLLRNTVLQSEVATAQDWAEVAEDVAVEARPLAPVVSIHRPSPSGTGPLCNPKPGDAPDSVPVLVRFATAEGAASAAAKLTGRRFDGRVVTAHCVPEADFEAAIATAPAAAGSEAAAPQVDVD
ncbi:hypothetical protein FNF31_07584 [Cafeteria roenbergensis]|nr:hypothetical protein FNF31_07584 [Cafeteria roenbergensis]